MSTGAIPTVNSVKEHGVVRDEGLFDPITADTSHAARRRRSRCTPAHLESHPEATRTDSADQAPQPYTPMLATANANLATYLPPLESVLIQLHPNPNPPSTVTPARHPQHYSAFLRHRTALCLVLLLFTPSSFCTLCNLAPPRKKKRQEASKLGLPLAPPRRASPHSPPSPNAHSATPAWTESLAIRESTAPFKSSLRPQGVFDKHKTFSPRTPAPLATHATPSRRWRCRWRARACPRARAPPHRRSRAPRPPRLGAVFATTAPIPPPSARAAGDGTGVGGAGRRALNSSSRIPVPSARNPSRLYVQDGDFNFAFAAPPSGHGRGHGRGVQHGRGRSVEDVADGKGKKTKTDAAPHAQSSRGGADARRRRASRFLPPQSPYPGPWPPSCAVATRASFLPDFKLLYETIVLLHFWQASFHPGIVDLIRNCTSTFLRLEIPAIHRSCRAAYAYAYSNKLMRLSWCRSTYQPRDFTLEHDIKVRVLRYALALLPIARRHAAPNAVKPPPPPSVFCSVPIVPPKTFGSISI
ncbi:hypothetical protein B0H13DRAFT_1889575 [Mycena leptocephala]|nr:hypothetical protein B0H13DRAFT_1889575 [Mycena leptocephala]